MIPNVMRTSSGDQSASAATGSVMAEQPPVEHSTDKLPLTSDPECYAMVLQFYDGLCEWEEGSSTPVLHITWAQHALYSLGRFDFKARANLTLKSAAPMDDVDARSDDSAVSSHSAKLKQMSESLQRSSQRSRGRQSKPTSPVDDGDKSVSDVNANQASLAEEASDAASVPPDAANIEDKSDTAADKISDDHKSPPLTTDDTVSEISAGGDALVVGKGEDTDAVQACLMLRSEKMMGMKDLLVAERLNSGAIKLQLTAQSQVHLRHSRTAAAAEFVASDGTPSSVPRKRIRRE